MLAASLALAVPISECKLLTSPPNDHCSSFLAFSADSMLAVGHEKESSYATKRGEFEADGMLAVGDRGTVPMLPSEANLRRTKCSPLETRKRVHTPLPNAVTNEMHAVRKKK